jgi:hypothetical protein
MKYEKHELAALFPAMTPEERRELRESIKGTYQIEPIITFEKKILEGWHRYQACIELGITPRFQDFQSLGYSGNGIHPADYVWAMNATRRHLPKETMATLKVKYEAYRSKEYPTYRGAIRELGDKERAERAGKEEQVVKAVVNEKNFRQGGGTRLSRNIRKLGIGKTTTQMAKEIGVSEVTVRQAVRLAAEAPRKFNSVAAGRVPLHEAIKELPLTERQKENRKKRIEYYRQGLKLSDTIRTLIRKAEANGGKLYVEVGGYGIQLRKACHVEQDALDRLSGK